MKTIRLFIQYYWYKIIKKKLSTSPIPRGAYCYTTLTIDKKKGLIHTKACPYYKMYGKYNERALCLYMQDREDICLDDMCKICGVKERVTIDFTTIRSNKK